MNKRLVRSLRACYQHGPLFHPWINHDTVRHPLATLFANPALSIAKFYPRTHCACSTFKDQLMEWNMHIQKLVRTAIAHVRE